MGPEVGADRAGLGRAPSCPGQLPAWRGLFGFRDGGEGAGPGAEPELLEESLGHERVLPPRPRQRVCTPVLTFVVRSGGWGEVTPASSSENGLSTARGHGLLGGQWAHRWVFTEADGSSWGTQRGRAIQDGETEAGNGWPVGTLAQAGRSALAR